MKRNQHKSVYAVAILLFYLCYSSCKKSEIDSNDLVAYVANNLSPYQEIPVNSGDTVIADINLIYLGKLGSGFQALINGTSGKDVEVTGKIDANPQLIKAYDSLYHMHSLALPSDLFKISGDGKVTIKAGQMQSADSIKIELNNISGLKVGKYTYVVPIVLESMAKDVQLKSKLMFVRYKLVVNPKNNVDRTNAGLSGQQIDRTGWSTTALSYYDVSAPSNVLDGENETVWESDGIIPQWLMLDMGMTETVKGFSIVPNYVYPGDDFIDMDVLSSKDGITWEMQGKYTGTSASAQSSADLPDIKTVKFINPVTARYFKFNVTSSTGGGYAGMAELNGIK